VRLRDECSIRVGHASELDLEVSARYAGDFRMQVRMERSDQTPVRSLDLGDVAARIETEYPPRAVRPMVGFGATVAIACAPSSVEKRGRREGQGRRHLSWTPNGHAKAEPRVAQALEKGEALLRLPSQGRCYDARGQAKVLYENLAMKAP
jgi:hypothetical protein